MGFNGQAAGQGAVSGGLAGAAFGPVGAGIGAVAGGALGGLFGGGPEPYQPDKNSFNVPGYDQQNHAYTSLANRYGGRAAPQMRAYGIGGTQMADSSFRGDQTALVRQLQAQAAGRGPGQRLVQMHAQNAADRGMQQQMGNAAGAAPGSGAGAARSAALAGGQMQSAVGQQSAMGGLEAQLGAMGQLGGVLSGARGQDLSRNQANMQARMNTQLANQSANMQAGQANMGAQLQSRGMNDQAQLEALRQRQALSGMQQSGMMGYEGLRAGGVNGMAQTQAGQPSWFDRTMGQVSGMGKMGMMDGNVQSQPGAPSAMWAPSQSMYPGLGQ